MKNLEKSRCIMSALCIMLLLDEAINGLPRTSAETNREERELQSKTASNPDQISTFKTLVQILTQQQCRS
jgi:hypothetical protein